MLTSGDATMIGYDSKAVLGYPFARGGAAAVGEVWAHDFARTAPETTNAVVGDRNSCYSNIIAPTTQEIRAGVLCVIEQAAADDQQARAIYDGPCYAQVSGAVAAGDLLVARTDKKLGAPTANGQKIIARALEAGTNTTILVEFSGVHGFTVNVE
jgi:hypothetical protein